ncbi:ribonuclease M5 [Weissella coleopterorum]|uniref:Ribonuclease M5 n=1 Tax=Weissella coleopterorum TaxID=2714949 RepID=A0A6G8AY37_9LACO|nr:ribonuclease M5 [Weissella coleopterorum]QIL49978.1 ribonuclease M5 [Weissella coleopterorum]
MKINEIIIVEGKSDTEKVKRAVEADTIETNGSALDPMTQNTIVRAANARGVIVFTDPDFNGERIRKIVTQIAPNAKHAFLTKDEAGAQIKHHSLGIEYATIEIIQKTLQQVAGETSDAHISDITRKDLLNWGLINGSKAASRRTYLAERLNLGYVNGKQFMKRIQMFGIQRKELLEVLAELE